MDAGFMELVIEGDNAIVMKSILSPRANRSRLGHICEDVRYLVASLRGMSVSCVKHCANFVAHSLAHYTSKLDEDIVWLEESPPPTLEALYLDSNSLNE